MRWSSTPGITIPLMHLVTTEEVPSLSGMQRHLASGRAAALAAAVVVLAGCGVVGNQARINALHDEFESTQFPYDVTLDEGVSLAGPNFDRTDINDRNRIGGLARLDRDMFEVTDETLEWLPSAGWESPVTGCNEDDGEITATFIGATKDLGNWHAQIRFGINPTEDGGTIVGVHLDAPPAGEDSLPRTDGDVAPCWEK